MAIDFKYGTITAEKKTFFSDEPVFVLRGADPLAFGAILHYLKTCEQAGCRSEHLQACLNAATLFLEWQRGHRDLIKPRPD